MITLFQFDPAFGLPNASAFCMKVETYLRMVGLEYRLAPRANILKAPKGKMPWIEDDGRVVADSGFIIDYLKDRYGDPLDARLTPEEQAIALAFRRLLEENLYWAIVYGRWFTPEGWTLTRGAFFGGLPPVLRDVVPAVARRGMRKEIWGHGLGRHSPEEIYAIGQADITALADFLGDKPYSKAGDRLEIRIGVYQWHITVRALTVRRGPAAAARLLYEESEESRLARQAKVAEHRTERNPSAALQGRPTKRDRRQLDRLTDGD